MPEYPTNTYEIETLWELVREVQDQKTGGYDVDFDIKPNLEKARYGDGFFTIIEVTSTEPNPQANVNGEWWFDADGQIMQVL